jgi:tetratricopeptide (TPR) repeat protein
MDKRTELLKQAIKSFKAGKVDATIVKYKEILDLKPDDLKVRQIVGDLELKQNNTVEAIRQFEWIADYYLKDGFFTKSIAMYKRISRIDPNYQEAFFKLAELYTKQGLIIEAKQIYLDMAEEFKRQMNQKRALDMYKKILEFDRNNVKMRLLLADSYLKEGLEDAAIEEYLIATDILINRKEFDKVEELVDKLKTKLTSTRLTEKLVTAYSHQGRNDEAIQMLLDQGDVLYQHTSLLKMLGELFFEQDRIDEAEAVFKKVAAIDPSEAEVILKLGRVYLQREEYAKTFELFAPVVEAHIAKQQYDEASSFLRFIIASNNTFMPALYKLAEIFEKSGKTNNLIALYESMLPLFEKSGAKDKLIETLEKLIKLSDKPFTYEEHLSRIKGVDAKEEAREEAFERVQESISFTLRLVDESIRESDYAKAEQLLIKAKRSFPENLDILRKIYDFYQLIGQIEKAVNEGKSLLEALRNQGHQEEYNLLLQTLSQIHPEDDQLVEMSGNESTNIDIDFDQDELEEQLAGMADSQVLAMHSELPEADILVLSEENTIDEPDPLESSKTLSSVFSELDFYINDGYFGDAEKLISELKKKYPENNQLITRIERFKKEVHKDTADARPEPALKIPPPPPAKAEPPPPQRTVSGVREFDLDAPMNTEMDLSGHFNDELVIDNLLPEQNSQAFSDEMDLEVEFDSQINISEPEPRPVSRPTPPPPPPPPPPPAPPSRMKSSADIQSALFEIEQTVSKKSGTGSFLRPTDLEMPAPKVEDLLLPNEEVFELDNDAIESGEFTFDAQLEDSQPVSPVVNKPDIRSSSGSFADAFVDTLAEEDPLELNDLLKEEDELVRTESPFQEISQTDIPFDQDEDLLGEDLLVFDSPSDYMTTEDNIPSELASLNNWVKELEKQRTSTIEKNMMEIFEEFKRGVDEKIGTEDYDTRYNLGIAYKEMGLIEESIHEFLISSKHPLKFFDSAGLLGMCFRDKGMYEEAIAWFERALETVGRQKEEYLAIKYELVQTLKAKEDYERALTYIKEIRGEDRDYRDIAQLHAEIKSLAD